MSFFRSLALDAKNATRLRLLAGIVLLLTVFGLYGAYYSARVSSLGPSIDNDVYLASAEEEDGLATVLHPEQHIFRDARTIRLQWNITLGQRAPDGVTKQVYLVNGQFPGPTIEARSGDELVIEVLNSLENDEDLAIHWHGLSMRGANEMDGVVGLTQCAIGKSQSFTYRFRIEDTQAGTFWYHAHSGVQRVDGLYGGLVIHRPAAQSTSEMSTYQYDRELLLLVGDWYHRQAHEVLDYYLDWKNFGIEPPPDSLLINGKGHFNCSMAVPARPVQCEQVAVPQLKFNGGRSRLRVINTGALTGFTLSMSGTEMKLIQVDGGNTVVDAPRTESISILYPGERMDVIIERAGGTQDRESTLTVALDQEHLRFKNFALTPIQSFPILWLSYTQSAGRTTSSLANRPESMHVPFLSLGNITGPVLTADDIPQKRTQTFVLYTKIEILAKYRNIPKGFVNRTSWVVEDAKSPPLLALDRSEWQKQQKKEKTYVPWATPSGEGQWLDIVLNNLDDTGHPFHLHGYDFYVLSSHRSPSGRYEAYNPFDPTVAVPAGGPLDTLHPVRKDTVYVPRIGYVVMRMPLNNDGLWFLHCHTIWHQAVGMGIAFQVGEAASASLAEAKSRASALCTG